MIIAYVYIVMYIYIYIINTYLLYSVPPPGLAANLVNSIQIITTTTNNNNNNNSNITIIIITTINHIISRLLRVSQLLLSLYP